MSLNHYSPTLLLKNLSPTNDSHATCRLQSRLRKINKLLEILLNELVQLELDSRSVLDKQCVLPHNVHAGEQRHSLSPYRVSTARQNGTLERPRLNNPGSLRSRVCFCRNHRVLDPKRSSGLCKEDASRLTARFRNYSRSKIRACASRLPALVGILSLSLSLSFGIRYYIWGFWCWLTSFLMAKRSPVRILKRLYIDPVSLPNFQR